MNKEIKEIFDIKNDEALRDASNVENKRREMANPTVINNVEEKAKQSNREACEILEIWDYSVQHDSYDKGFKHNLDEYSSSRALTDEEKVTLSRLKEEFVNNTSEQQESTSDTSEAQQSGSDTSEAQQSGTDTSETQETVNQGWDWSDIDL